MIDGGPRVGQPEGQRSGRRSGRIYGGDGAEAPSLVHLQQSREKWLECRNKAPYLGCAAAGAETGSILKCHGFVWSGAHNVQ